MVQRPFGGMPEVSIHLDSTRWNYKREVPIMGSRAVLTLPFPHWCQSHESICKRKQAYVRLPLVIQAAYMKITASWVILPTVVNILH